MSVTETMTQTCCVAGCSNTNIAARGMCWKHYARWRRTGEAGQDSDYERPDRCSVPGCTRPHNAHGYCAMHYKRWREWGDPSYVKIEPWDGSYTDLVRRTSRDPDTGCWHWTRGFNYRGYPVITRAGRNEYVHRLVWDMTLDQYPERVPATGLRVGRRCGNRSCVNPDHLMLTGLSPTAR